MNTESEREIRALFDDWFEAAAARDIDASMRPIARDVVSYEHDAPLQYDGVDAVRAVCQDGFDRMKGEFRWDVPNLKIVVAGGIAVAWGLNRMRAEEPGKAPVEMWSRGTRVFENVNGAWRMIHQHVSFPVDSTTGQAAVDLRP